MRNRWDGDPDHDDGGDDDDDEEEEEENLYDNFGPREVDAKKHA